MGKSTISKQAESYAEVIVGQIASNFHDLHDKVNACEELKDVRKKYDAISPNDDTLMTLDDAKKRLEIIENHIGDLICDKHNTVEPLAVGLFGEWGSGKTHQLKLIQQKILERPINLEDKQDTFPQITIPVFFNAWRFEKEEHIIIPLFKTLLVAIENYERTLSSTVQRSLKSLVFHMKNVLMSAHKGISLGSIVKTAKGVVTEDVEALAEFSNILNPKEVIKAGQQKTNTEQVGEQTLTELLKSDPLESIYLNIPQWIEKITLFENVNFVFLIDDLDRCLPENTLKMLESIKLFLDVPSCAFVLAVDDDVVERGVVHHYRDYLSIYHNKDTEDAKGVLQHELPITGHEYLEKMIQLPIRLPVIDTVNVREFLEEHSQGWLKYLKTDEGQSQLEPLDMTERKIEIHKAPYEVLLDFFESRIPPKPRKIKREIKSN